MGQEGRPHVVPGTVTSMNDLSMNDLSLLTQHRSYLMLEFLLFTFETELYSQEPGFCWIPTLQSLSIAVASILTSNISTIFIHFSPLSHNSIRSLNT